MLVLLIIRPTLCAGMAELVDAADSKSVACEGVSVRFRLSVPARNSKKALIDNNQGFFYGQQKLLTIRLLGQFNRLFLFLRLDYNKT